MTTPETLPPDPWPDSVVASRTRTVDFGGLPILYDERVLEPRGWTERQSRWAAELLPDLPEGPVLELCAGAGHIGLRAVLGSGRRLVSVELDPVAAAYAAANALAVGLGVETEVREGQLDAVLGADEHFPLIIADPPYLRSDETGQYAEDPLLAVEGGPDGLDVARRCLSVIEAHLAPEGTALLQLRDLSQVDRLAAELTPRLRIVEVEQCAGRGVLVRLDRALGDD